MINYYTIGQRVKEARKKKRLSQADLADLIDKSTSYISYMETGIKCMSLETLVDIANALDISADFILADCINVHESVSGNSRCNKGNKREPAGKCFHKADGKIKDI